MNRYWVSWVQPGDDYRPLNFPPGPGVIGWWKSGECDEGATLCAWIEADSEEAAKEIIYIDWPEAGELGWRFVDLCDPEFVPNNRFPPSDWMLSRYPAESQAK